MGFLTYVLTWKCYPLLTSWNTIWDWLILFDEAGGTRDREGSGFVVVWWTWRKGSLATSKLHVLYSPSNPGYVWNQIVYFSLMKMWVLRKSVAVFEKGYDFILYKIVLYFPLLQYQQIQQWKGPKEIYTHIKQCFKFSLENKISLLWLQSSHPMEVSWKPVCVCIIFLA